MSEQEPFKILDDTIEVVNQGETFLFRIPNSRDEGRFAANLKKIRREVDPDSVGPGEEYGWDADADMHMRSAAWFMTCLTKTSAEWVYSSGTDGKPTIDWGKWPAKQTNRVVEVAFAFLSGVSRFRQSGNQPEIPQSPDGKQTLDSRENPQPVPV